MPVKIVDGMPNPAQAWRKLNAMGYGSGDVDALLVTPWNSTVEDHLDWLMEADHKQLDAWLRRDD